MKAELTPIETWNFKVAKQVFRDAKDGSLRYCDLQESFENLLDIVKRLTEDS